MLQTIRSVGKKSRKTSDIRILSVNCTKNTFGKMIISRDLREISEKDISEKDICGFPLIVSFLKKLSCRNSPDSRCLPLRLAQNFVRVFLRAWARRRCPRTAGRTITNASRRACTRAYTRASACTRLGAAPFPPRGRRRSRRSSVIELAGDPK